MRKALLLVLLISVLSVPVWAEDITKDILKPRVYSDLLKKNEVEGPYLQFVETTNFWKTQARMRITFQKDVGGKAITIEIRLKREGGLLWWRGEWKIDKQQPQKKEVPSALPEPTRRSKLAPASFAFI